jgi:hypothetical protein
MGAITTTHANAKPGRPVLVGQLAMRAGMMMLRLSSQKSEKLLLSYGIIIACLLQPSFDIFLQQVAESP